MDSTFYLAHNINQKTLKGGKARTVTNSVFKADFDPPFPNIETPFIATKRIYASLSERSPTAHREAETAKAHRG